jgi:hypothetical protein
MIEIPVSSPRTTRGPFKNINMDNQKDFAGKGGFIWWVGFVEDRMDPLKLGRLKVRAVGWDADNKMQLSTDALPWAQVAFPVNQCKPICTKRR